MAVAEYAKSQGKKPNKSTVSTSGDNSGRSGSSHRIAAGGTLAMMVAVAMAPNVAMGADYPAAQTALNGSVVNDRRVAGGGTETLNRVQIVDQGTPSVVEPLYTGLPSPGRKPNNKTGLTPDQTAGAKFDGGSLFGGLAIGDGSESTKAASMAIGQDAKSDGVETVAVGRGSYAGRQGSVALGTVAMANNLYSVAVGRQAVAFKNYDIAIGGTATAHGHRSLAIGYSTQASGLGSIAIGSADGVNGTVEAFNSTTNTVASENNAIALGAGAKAQAENAITLGQKAKVETGANNAFAFGQGTNVGANAIAFGKGANIGASATNAIALGQGASVAENATDALAFGTTAQAQGAESVAIGKGANVANTITQAVALAVVLQRPKIKRLPWVKELVQTLLIVWRLVVVLQLRLG